MLRFACSPTGDMHIDDLRVALLNYIISKQKNEDLIVRIDDMNKEKNIEGKDQEILALLELFHIKYSQVVYQSQNIRFYSAMALDLLHKKKAFACFCSHEWLENKKNEAKAAKKPYKYDDACRNLPAELVIDNTAPFTVRIARPEQATTSDPMDSFVIMRQDKTPTYNFACAIDDMLSDISIIIRKDEQKNDTAKELHVRNSLGYDKEIEYAYLPALLDTPSVKELLEDGYLPEAISNYLISTINEPLKEIFTLQKAIEWFDLGKISKTPTHFDIDILKHINKEHLKNLEAKELSRYVGFADEEIGELARIYLNEANTTKELKAKIAPIFSQRVIPGMFAQQATLMAQTIKDAPYFEAYIDFKNHIMKETGLEGESFLKPLQILLTNAEHGPDVAKVYKYLKNYIQEIVK